MRAGDRVRDSEKKVLKERDTSPEDSAAEAEVKLRKLKRASRSSRRS